VDDLLGIAHDLRRELSRRARQPRPAEAVDLLIDSRRCGFSSPRVARFVADEVDGFTLDADELRLDLPGGDPGVRSERLADAARALAKAGLVSGWRDELLDVPDASGEVLARIERAACRTFAIATRAVHLNGWTADGRLWVAQRSLKKSIDPGCWDTLVGGMLAAGETEHGALEREAHEEAGLKLAGVAPPTKGGDVLLERPVAEGFQVETIVIFDLVLPDDVQPHNLDREVERFALREPRAVLQAIGAGEFTLEAALVTLAGLVRRLEG
jgi:8-oxo-dGTP pyrophosphatase MutT (NUDIX family)